MAKELHFLIMPIKRYITSVHFPWVSRYTFCIKPGILQRLQSLWNSLIFGGRQKLYFKIARLLNTTITITAQSKYFSGQNNGFSQNCSLMASPELGPREDHHNFDIYLARIWRDYLTVIFMESFMDSVVNPRGWYE